MTSGHPNFRGQKIGEGLHIEAKMCQNLCSGQIGAVLTQVLRSANIHIWCDDFKWEVCWRHFGTVVLGEGDWKLGERSRYLRRDPRRWQAGSDQDLPTRFWSLLSLPAIVAVNL